LRLPTWRDGKPVVYRISSSCSHSIGVAIAMGNVNNAAGVTTEFIQSGRFEINVSGRHFPARAFLRAPYDPGRKKILS